MRAEKPMEQDRKRQHRSRWRRMLKWSAVASIGGTVILVTVFVFLFRTALYHRFILFPRQAEAWAKIEQQRREVDLDDGWPEFRGCCHVHSELSHDSEATFPEILEAAKAAEIDFLLMADHCVDGKADYSLGWKGLHDGVLFVRGFEMDYGFMPWGLPDSTLLDRAEKPPRLAEEISGAGGLLFFAHCEEERRWDLPQLVGMEIYNIHTDLADETIQGFLPSIILCLGAYGDQVMRLVFDRQTEILTRWDELNRSRRIVGIQANDTHRNQGLRGYYTNQDTFLLRERGSGDVGEWRLNTLTRTLLRWCYGPLNPGKALFRVTLDPYARSLRFSNTHVLAAAQTEEALLDGLRQGRVFVGFDMLADARGFTFLAEARGRKRVMGENVELEPGLTLNAGSPVPCRFLLLRDGTRVAEGNGRRFTHRVRTPGNYRLEAELDILGEWTPWVYTNPIRIHPSSP